MSDIDTTKIGAALELIIDAASQHAVDRLSAGRLALYGELAAALTAAEARGAQRERARISATIGLAVKEWREIAWQRELDAAPDVSEVAVSLDECAATLERIVGKQYVSAYVATTCERFPKPVSGTPDALAVQP
jgi:hypothetical protein